MRLPHADKKNYEPYILTKEESDVYFICVMMYVLYE